TRRLVAVASPNPPSDTHEVAAVAETLLRKIPGMEGERIETQARVVSLIGRLKSTRPGRRLVFNGHLDTFPLLEALPWTVPPLGGVLKDGKLYGRGVCDMKGGMACSLLAAALLARHRDAWSGEIVLTLAGDEENMGSLGTGYMMQHVPHARGDANICGDVGSPRIVRFGEKGLMWVQGGAAGAPGPGGRVSCAGERTSRTSPPRRRPPSRRRSPGPGPFPSRCRAPAKPRHCSASPPISARSSAAPRPTSCPPMPSPAPTSACPSASPPMFWRPSSTNG